MAGIGLGNNMDSILNGGTLPEVTITGSKSASNSGGGSSIWDSLFSNFAGIGQGIGGIILALKTDPNAMNNQSFIDRILGTGYNNGVAYPYGTQPRTNTTTYIVIGVVLIAVVMLFVMMGKKSAA